jgi:hypothetical protein
MTYFSYEDGGTVVQYYMAKILKQLGQNVKILTCSGICTENEIFNDFYNNDFPIDDNAIVIYCEGTHGNPLNAKYAVRWMLSELGQNTDYDRVETWGKNELVYYFNSELKFEENPEKIGKIYKNLNCIFLNPIVKQTNFSERAEFCYTTRKMHMHKKEVTCLHPKDSFRLTSEHSIENCVEIFNSHKYFICYDPLSFYAFIAPLCGCITIVYKTDGLNKQQWLQKTFAAEYMKHKGIDNLYGIAYGIEDLEYAENTIHLMKEQLDDIINFCIEKTIIPFINDIQNFENMENTIQNNYF